VAVEAEKGEGVKRSLLVLAEETGTGKFLIKAGTGCSQG